MFFTAEDYKKILKWLIQNSIKDTEFVEANLLEGDETIAFVLQGRNVKVSLRDFSNLLFAIGVSDFLNVTSKYNERVIPIEKAIQLVPYRSRKLGLVITFLNEKNKWVLYQFQGERLNQWNTIDLWIDIIGSMSNVDVIPDNEDLYGVKVENKTMFKFADKLYDQYSFSGLGRKLLRKNIVKVIDPITGKESRVNLLTLDMVGKENTIYHIQYDYNLNGQTITIPTNCTLQFDGGSIKNGTITFTNTILTGNICVYTYINGSIKNTELKISWFNKINDALNVLLKLSNHIIIIDEEIHVNSANTDYVYLINTPNILKCEGVGKIIIDNIVPTCNLFKLYPIVDKEGYGLYDLIIENPNNKGNHIIYIELIEPGQVLRKFYINNCMFPVSNGYNIYLEHPVTLDGYFTSTIEKCTFKGGMRLNRLGDSVTISNCVFTQKHGVYIENVPSSNQCVFKENNVTCDEGLNFYRCLNLRILNNNIECSNDNVVLPNNSYVNISGVSLGNPSQGTVLEGNTFVYGAKSSIETTINMVYLNNLLAPIISGNLFVQREKAKGLILGTEVQFANINNNFISGIPWSGDKIIVDNGVKTIFNNKILQLSGENYLGNLADIIAEKYGSKKIEDYTGTTQYKRFNTKVFEDLSISRNISDVIKKSYRIRHINAEGYYENDTTDVLFVTDNGFEFPSLKGVQVKNSAGYTSRISFGGSIPTTGAHSQGDIRFNLLSTDLRRFGWTCVEGGSPGKWKPLDLSMRGSTGLRPPLSGGDHGTSYFDTTLNCNILWDGAKWLNQDGTNLVDVKQVIASGTIRPSNPLIGQTFFDISLVPGKMIVYNGTTWVNMDGTPLT